MRKRIVLTLITVIVLGTGGYNVYNFLKKSRGAKEESAKTILQKDLSRFANLKNPKLDTSIFQDPTYKILENTPEGLGKTPLPAAAGTGRANPFLPF